MLKHWHYEHMRQIFMDSPELRGQLSPSVIEGEAVWPADKEGSDYRQWESAKKAVSDCAISDVHGFLLTTKKKGEASEEQAGGRRTSCVQFSWLLPVIDHPEYGSSQVIHSRVASDPEAKVKIGNKTNPIQMPYHKSYASDRYAFVATFDPWRIGRMETGEYVLADEEKRRVRILNALRAFKPLLSGHFGASWSHAVPHVNLRAALAGYSVSTLLPLPCSPIYPGWVEKTVNMFPGDGNGMGLIGFGDELAAIEEAKRRIVMVDGLEELLNRLEGML